MAGDQRRELAAALSQDCAANAAAVLVFTAVERRTTRKYGSRGVRYMHIEVSHAAQNVFLQATALAWVRWWLALSTTIGCARR